MQGASCCLRGFSFLFPTLAACSLLAIALSMMSEINQCKGSEGKRNKTRNNSYHDGNEFKYFEDYF